MVSRRFLSVLVKTDPSLFHSIHYLTTARSRSPTHRPDSRCPPHRPSSSSRDLITRIRQRHRYRSILSSLPPALPLPLYSIASAGRYYDPLRPLPNDLLTLHLATSLANSTTSPLCTAYVVLSPLSPSHLLHPFATRGGQTSPSLHGFCVLFSVCFLVCACRV